MREGQVATMSIVMNMPAQWAVAFFKKPLTATIAQNMRALMMNALIAECSPLYTVDSTVVMLPDATTCETEKNTRNIAHFTSASNPVVNLNKKTTQIIVQIMDAMNQAALLAKIITPNIVPLTIVNQATVLIRHPIRHTATFIVAAQ